MATKKRRLFMRHIIKRIVKTVTIVTWTIQWTEEAADENPLTRQRPGDNVEQTHLALGEDQPPWPVFNPQVEEAIRDATEVTAYKPLTGEPPSLAIYKSNLFIDQGEKP
jgi:hypothetical protein